MNQSPESPFPSKEQELLLKAALLKDQEALNAWEEWCSLVDLDESTDQGSFRLLPLLYKNLLRNKIKTPHANKLKGVYRQAWYKNNKLLYEADKLIVFFQNSGIETIVLKGAALSKLYYKDMGIRPMADIDILVPFPKAKEASDLLKSTGWEPEFEEYIEYNLQYGRSMQFMDQSGFELDLHWHPFFEANRDSDHKSFWDKAVELQIGGVRTLSLCPADMLLHTFIHGISWNKEPPIRWVADAYYIIHSTDLFLDWERFIHQVRKYKVVLLTREAMKYLSINFHVQFPETIMRELSQIKVTRTERLVYKESQKDPEDYSDRFFTKLYKLFVIYLQQSERTNALSQLVGFVAFLRFRTRDKNYFSMLVYYLSMGRKWKSQR